MNTLKPLFSLMFSEYYSLRRFLGTTNTTSKKKTIAFILVILYALGSVLFSIGYLFFTLGEILHGVNQIQLLIGFIFGYLTLFTVMYVILRADGYLFHFRDYELIAPLPIKPLVILIVRMLLLMIMLWFMLFFITLPIAFVYFWFHGLSASGIITYLVGILFIPMIPTVLFSFVSVLLKKMTSFLPHSKIWTTIFLLILTIGLMIFMFSFSLQVETENPLLGQVGFIGWLVQYYPVAQWFTNAFHSAQWFDLIGVVLLNGGVMVLFVISVSKVMVTLNSKSQNKRNIAKKDAQFASSTLFQSLVIKEVRRFLNVPIYAMNSGIGVVLLLLAAGASLIFKADIMTYLQLEDFAALPMELVVMGLSAFCLGMVYTSAVSLSLEGKQLWIVKSLPIPPLELMKAKIFFNILLQLPIGLLSIGLFTIAFEFTFEIVLALLLFTIVFSFLTSLLYALVNLYLPKFNFINETEVVKGSSSAMVAILGTMAVLVIIVFSMIGLINLLSIPASIFVVTTVMLLLTILSWVILLRVTERVFIKLTP